MEMTTDQITGLLKALVAVGVEGAEDRAADGKRACGSASGFKQSAARHQIHTGSFMVEMHSFCPRRHHSLAP